MTVNRDAIEATVWLSLFAAPLGSFLVFRRLSFFGDALSHAALSGVALVFLLVGASSFWLPIGALGSVLVTSVFLYYFEKKAKLPSDVALTVSYSGMFALGVLLIKSGDVDLEHLLLGDIWSIQKNMLWFLRVWTFVVIGVLLFWWRPLWASVMDSRFARGLGYKTSLIDLLFLVLTAVSVVGMIQSVGVILVAAYLVLPAASSLPWVRSLRALALMSVGFAGLGSLIGIWISARFGLLAGPSIAVIGFLLVILSHLLRSLVFVRLGLGSGRGNSERANRH